MSRAIVSSKGNFKATIGRKKDGTYSVSTYVRGCGEYDDLQTFIQDGLPTLEAAKAWAETANEDSEQELLAVEVSEIFK